MRVDDRPVLDEDLGGHGPRGGRRRHGQRLLHVPRRAGRRPPQARARTGLRRLAGSVRVLPPNNKPNKYC